MLVELGFNKSKNICRIKQGGKTITLPKEAVKEMWEVMRDAESASDCITIERKKEGADELSALIDSLIKKGIRIKRIKEIVSLLEDLNEEK